jgi:hypothetical protein
VVKPLNGEYTVVRFDEFKGKKKEEQAITATIAELSKYNMWIGHNIERFDYRYLKSKLFLFDLGAMPRPWYYDTCKVFRALGFMTKFNMVGKPAAGLDSAVDFFGFYQMKTKLMPNYVSGALKGPKEKRTEVMNKVVEHCIGDVLMNEKMYFKLIDEDHQTIIRRFR